jgi:hypothetical protein
VYIYTYRAGGIDYPGDYSHKDLKPDLRDDDLKSHYMRYMTKVKHPAGVSIYIQIFVYIHIYMFIYICIKAKHPTGGSKSVYMFVYSFHLCLFDWSALIVTPPL